MFAGLRITRHPLRGLRGLSFWQRVIARATGRIPASR